MAATERQPLLRSATAVPEGMDDAQRRAMEMQQKADDMVNDVMRSCGGDTWCQNIVDSRQFEEYPAMTLLVARVIRALLTFFIIVCVIALVMSYFFEGKITTIEEIDQQEFMPAPNVVICPQPWGAVWSKGGLEVEGAKVQQVPGGVTDRELNFTRVSCNPISERLSKCNCFEFQSNLLYPHGSRGNLDYLDYIRFTFKADTGEDMKKSTQYAFGFYPDVKNIPQQWTYGQLGHISEGDVKLEEVAHGKTEFTEGTTIARYAFRMTGEAPDPTGKTTLVFGYDKYLAFIISSFGDKFSVFAIMTILITFCAAINNFGLFDIFFPEKVDELEPAQLEPNMCCVAVFGGCCMFCNPKAQIAKEAASRAASPGPSARETPSASPARPATVSEEP